MERAKQLVELGLEVNGHHVVLIYDVFDDILLCIFRMVILHYIARLRKDMQKPPSF